MASSVSSSHSNYLASQDWNRPFVFPDDQMLQPLQLSEYSQVSDWNGLPLFWRDREVVQIFELDNASKDKFIYPYRELAGCDAMLVETSERDNNGAVHLIQTLATPLFKTNIAYYADLAAGTMPDPLRITHDLPPSNLLIPIECQGISVRMDGQLTAKEGWIVLIPLTTEEYRTLGDRWDRLPLFKDPDGEIVRPYVFLDENQEPLMTDSYQGIGPYFLFMPYAHDNPETRSKFRLKHNDDDMQIASQTIKLLYDQPIHQEEEKNE